ALRLDRGELGLGQVLLVGLPGIALLAADRPGLAELRRERVDLGVRQPPRLLCGGLVSGAHGATLPPYTTSIAPPPARCSRNIRSSSATARVASACAYASASPYTVLGKPTLPSVSRACSSIGRVSVCVVA